MNAPLPPPRRDALPAAPAMRVLERVVAEGREVLSPADVAALLESLGLNPPAGAPAGETVDLRIALQDTREYGLVLSAGLGGTEGAMTERALRRGLGRTDALVGLTDAADFLEQFRGTYAYRATAGVAQRGGRPVPDEALADCFASLLALADALGANPAAGWSLGTLELDPVRIGVNGTLDVAAARCTLAKRAGRPLPRPRAKIDKLLHPARMGIVGVSSTAMNFGRIILRNLVGSGYPKAQITILRPGEAEIDGVRCVADLASLDHRLDLLIVAVNADAVYGLVDEIIATDKVDAVMLIPGGLGETAKSREPAAAMAARINAAHAGPGGGPVFLGANCLGVVSHPGGYDSWFIPLERLPKPAKKAERTAAMLSQSGAFMITRLSHNPWLDPRYMIATGNQTDLTHGDLLAWCAERPEIETIGVYLEGFRDLDGRDFANAVRSAVRNGKDVVVYKAGRTMPGAGAAFGHTASVAGAYDLFESVLRQAGAIVADDVMAFDDLFYIAGALHGKTIGGSRLGALSGAGFEAVSMADAIASGSFAMTMADLAPATVERVREILAAKRLDALVTVSNPLDMNPGADDEAHLALAEAFLDDPGVDAVIVALDPTAPAVRALERSTLRPGHDLDDPAGTVHLMPPLVARHDKPVIGVVDAGSLYDAMTARLRDQGVCVFRNCMRATKALVRYVEARRYAAALRASDSLAGRDPPAPSPAP